MAPLGMRLDAVDGPVERRAREMEEVAETLRASGVEPIMAEATARRQQWSATLDLRTHFGPEGPKTYRDVLDVLARDGGRPPMDPDAS
jgi:hypothetical protein